MSRPEIRMLEVPVLTAVAEGLRGPESVVGSTEAGGQRAELEHRRVRRDPARLARSTSRNPVSKLLI